MTMATHSPRNTQFPRFSEVSKFHQGCMLTDVERPRTMMDYSTNHPTPHYSYSREPTRERLLQLAQPKEPRSEWYTSVGPHVRWGTQEMIWPIKKASLATSTTDRIAALASPKPNFLKGEKINRPEFHYSCGRASVLWKVDRGAKKATSTDRLNVLAVAKSPHKDFKEDRPQYTYSCGRESPLWKVNKNAMSSGDRPETLKLAKHKELHRDFIPEKSIQTMIPEPALKTQPSERLSGLSTPKPRPDGPFREPEWEVQGSAMNASATARCLELARPKGVTDGYQLPRDVEWSVTRAAKRAATTGRIEELSKPVIRATMDHVQFNPDAFLVKPLALKGSFPSRVHDLAKAIDR